MVAVRERVAGTIYILILCIGFYLVCTFIIYIFYFFLFIYYTMHTHNIPNWVHVWYNFI